MGRTQEVTVGILTGERVAGALDVYNLAIEGDHTFVAGGIIVHNCPRCAALDGQAWNLDGEKLTGTKVEFQSPPIHWNDRCVLSPIPKSFRDIGLNIDEPSDEGQRASSLGPVAGGTTFEQFFGRLSAAQQDAQFGKARAALFRAGKITIRDLVNGYGRELTLEELR